MDHYTFNSKHLDSQQHKQVAAVPGFWCCAGPLAEKAY